MFKIGDFSKLANLTVRALHHYEMLGLLIPMRVDKLNNYRYYSSQQLIIVNKIKMYQEIGLSLKLIKELLESEDQQVQEDCFEERAIEIERELEELQRQKAILQQLRVHEESTQINTYIVRLRTIPKRTVMSIRRKIQSYDDEHELWNSLHQEFMRQYVKMANPPLGMTIYHDQEYKDTLIDVEVQSDITGVYKDTGEVKFYTAPECLVASVVFSGTYEQMPQVTQTLATWIETNGYVICGPMINIPYVSPAQTSIVDEWITEAGHTVKKQ